MVHIPASKSNNRRGRTDGISPIGSPGVIGADLQRLTVKNTFYDCAMPEPVPMDLRRVVSEPSNSNAQFAAAAAWRQPMKVGLPSLQEGQMASYAAPPPQIAPLSLFSDECLMEPRLSDGLKVEDIPAAALWPPTPEAHLLPPGLTYLTDGPSRIPVVPPPTGPFPSGLIMGNDFVRLPTPATVSVQPPGPATLSTPEQARFGKSTSIAELQELLQSNPQTAHFRCPPGAQVLQWSYKQRSVGRVMFRAAVAFLHDGVPKHIAGSWGSSKKGARQSAAEIALALLHRDEVDVEECAAFVDVADLIASSGTPVAVSEHIEQLRLFCDERYGKDAELVWRCDSEGSQGWSATLKMTVLGVPHTLRGPPCESPEVACAELARRSLWFLGNQTFRGCYYPDGQTLLANNCKVNDPPSEWAEALSAAMNA